MKRRAKMRILAWVLTVCLCLGILPADMFGGIANVQAEEATNDHGVVKTTSDWDALGMRTTTYQCNQQLVLYGWCGNKTGA